MLSQVGNFADSRNRKLRELLPSLRPVFMPSGTMIVAESAPTLGSIPPPEELLSQLKKGEVET